MDAAAAKVGDKGFFEGFVGLLHGGFWGGCALRSAGVGKTRPCLDELVDIDPSDAVTVVRRVRSAVKGYADDIQVRARQDL